MTKRLVPITTSAALFLCGTALGGITTDGTLGPRQTLPGPNFNVLPSLGKQVGGNLFHSFNQFNIASGERATFSGPNSIHNILARVTGGTASSIKGTLACRIPNANLYLINPAGVVFGPDARLDIKGSIAVTTANSIKLAEGGKFNAALPGQSILTSAAPMSFGFLGERKPASISVRGIIDDNPAVDRRMHMPRLEVPVGKMITLEGGDITVEGGELRAPGGRIEIRAIEAAAETAPLRSSERHPKTASFFMVGGVLDTSAMLDPKGTATSNSRTAIVISVAGKFTSSNFSRIYGNRVVAIKAGGDVSLAENTIAALGGEKSSILVGAGGDVILAGSSSLLAADTFLGGLSSRGHVTVTARRDILISSATISSSGLSNFGSGGRIQLSARGRVALANCSINATGIETEPGLIEVSSGAALRLSSVRIHADAMGFNEMLAGGQVKVASSGAVSIFQSEITANAGAAGGIGGQIVIIGSKDMILGGDSRIAANGGGEFFHKGPGGVGGEITLSAGKSVSLLNHISLSATGGSGGANLISGSVEHGAGGRGGQVGVRAVERITLTGHSSISTLGGLGSLSGVSTVTGPGGRGGEIRLNAGRSISLSGNSGVFTDGGLGNPGGGGGQVTARSAGLIEIFDGGYVSAANRGPGIGGAIKLYAETLSIRDANHDPVLGTGIRSESIAGVRGGRADLSLSLSSTSTFGGPSLRLRSPAGTVVNVGTTDDIVQRFSDTPDSVTRQPVDPFAAFVGQPMRGLWILEVDNTSLYTGDVRAPVTLESIGLALGEDQFRSEARQVKVDVGDQVRVPIRVESPGVVTGTPGQNIGGSAGTITLDVGRLIINGPGQISTASLGTGRGGVVNILARGRIVIEGGSVTSRAGGSDRAGNVTITSGGSFWLRDANIIAEATGDGGSVAIAAEGPLVSRDSVITGKAGGTGAQISLRSAAGVALSRSVMNGLAGGADAPVNILAPFYFNDNSLILSDSQSVPSPANVAATTLTLQAHLGDTQPISNICGRRLQDVSSFLITSRGAGAPEPGGSMTDFDFEGLWLRKSQR